jgi:Ca2+-binding EF-hand superfamily protein
MLSAKLERAPVNTKLVFESLKALLRSRTSDFMRTFRDIDLNHSSTIDENELQRIASEAGWNLSQDEIKRVFDLFDHKKEGVITYGEFARTLA